MDVKPLIIGDLKANIPFVQGGMGVGIISTAQIGFRYNVHLG